ncbi:hypothetical protein CONLIGDRAFT_41246 [Coniochaeta ligniaria NRRL 30616]|uniref:Uncharacterized protein n=1 Tax=Coniochaeta ligniaria NRRL 30616 TaxID=1408157 RepID=A0A1J7JNX8_9PEZI|nr:hypothetical protein CONLIGDRAFT_41246 [Coniochaeta ligniaria NRRL 30616]
MVFSRPAITIRGSVALLSDGLDVVIAPRILQRFWRLNCVKTTREQATPSWPTRSAGGTDHRQSRTWKQVVRLGVGAASGCLEKWHGHGMTAVSTDQTTKRVRTRQARLVTASVLMLKRIYASRHIPAVSVGALEADEHRSRGRQWRTSSQPV